MSLTVPPASPLEGAQVMLSRVHSEVSTEESKAFLKSDGAKYVKAKTIIDSIVDGTRLLNAHFVIWLSEQIFLGDKTGIRIPAAPEVPAEGENPVIPLIPKETLHRMPCRQELERYEAGFPKDYQGDLPLPFIGKLEEGDIAYWDHTKKPECYIGNTKIVSVSHGWYTKKHIDPDNITLRLLAATLTSYLEVLGKTSIQYIAVFLDFTAFKQKTIREKTEAEKAQMKIALKSLNVWYAHNMCEVWLFTKMASHICKYVNDEYLDYTRTETATEVLGYHGRGWTYFENMISSLSSTTPMLDLGELIDGDLTEEKLDKLATLFTDPINKRRTLKKNRVLPVQPEQFDEVIKTKTFTNKGDGVTEGDMHDVKVLYKETYNDITQNVTVSDFNYCDWDKVTLLELCNTLLKNCEKLTYLSLRGNPEIDVEVANRLAEICVDKLKDMKIIDFGESIKDLAMPIAMGKFSDRKITVVFSADNVATQHSFELKAPEAGNTRRGNLTGSETLNDVTDTLYQAVDQMVEYTQNQERRMTANEDRIVRLEQEVTTLRELQASRRPTNRRRIANRIRSTDDNQIWS